MLGVVVAGYIIDHFCLWFETSVVRSMFYIWIYYRSFCLRADTLVFVMLRLVILSTITSRSLAHESSHWCGRLYSRHTCWKLDAWFVVCYIVDITVCGLTHQWFELQVFEYKLVVLLGYVILMTIAVWDVSPQRFMLSKLLFEVWHVSGWTTYAISDYHH